MGFNKNTWTKSYEGAPGLSKIGKPSTTKNEKPPATKGSK
jgi:hypothetical protein